MGSNDTVRGARCRTGTPPSERSRHSFPRSHPALPPRWLCRSGNRGPEPHAESGLDWKKRPFEPVISLGFEAM